MQNKSILKAFKSKKAKKHNKALNYLKIALFIAKNSKAKRKKVGAIISKKGRIISTGYNGTLAKNSNICEYKNKTLPQVIHAEENAILYALNNGANLKKAELFITISPCFNCAKLIVLAKIKKLYFIEKYRDNAPLKWLKKQGVKCIQKNL